LDFVAEAKNTKLKLNGRLGTFLVCLLLAALFWLFNSLSREYSTIIRVPVDYTNLPSKDLIAVELPDSVDAEVRASGFTLFAYKWTNATSSLKLDMRQARSVGNGDYALATQQGEERLKGGIGQGLKIVRIMPDTLLLSFSGATEKQVPVIPRVNVQCAPMYRLGDSIRTVPAFVKVTGSEALVKRIAFVETETQNYIGLDHPVNEPVKLVLPAGFGQLTIQPAEVNLVIPVGQYTEKRVLVPIEAQNLPANAILKTFPDKVEIVFQVPLEDYDKINADMFRAAVDYAKVTAQNKQLTVELIRQPLNIRNPRIEPQAVDFIIRR
jgi:hypothetical protein